MLIMGWVDDERVAAEQSAGNGLIVDVQAFCAACMNGWMDLVFMRMYPISFDKLWWIMLLSPGLYVVVVYAILDVNPLICVH
jgi:hypothetical protein